MLIPCYFSLKGHYGLNHVTLVGFIRLKSRLNLSTFVSYFFLSQHSIPYFLNWRILPIYIICCTLAIYKITNVAMAKRKVPQTKVSSISQLPTDGKVIAPLGFKSKVLRGSLTDLSAWVGFCTSSSQQVVKYQLW